MRLDKSTEYISAIRKLKLSEDFDAPYRMAIEREKRAKKAKNKYSLKDVYRSPRKVAGRIYRALRAKKSTLYLKKHTSPEVSIVIPIYNKSEHTQRCLRSLMYQKSKYSFEVIVVDNASQDNSQSLFSSVDGLVYQRNQENLGFVGGCNQGADMARGKYLVFLNNDTEVQGEWLNALIDKLDSEKSIGLVGSKLVYPDGRLQEAGGIIFKDGSGMNYGKFGDPGYFEYNYSREVDYCSGASIVIEKKFFEQLGGFDELYAPAYYEDTDLAFKARNAGKKVIYEPKSVVVHFEGATAGTDTGSGYKKYQEINHRKFVKKWHAILEREHYTPDQFYKGRDKSGQKLALIVDTIVPEIDKDSGSCRMFAIIKILQEMGYKVTFWPENLFATQPYTPMLQAMGVEVVYGTVSFTEFSKNYAKYYDLAIVSRPDVAVKFLAPCLEYFKHAKVIYDTVDLAFLRLDRQAKVEENQRLETDARAWQTIELSLIKRADNALVVSTVEKEILKQLLPGTPVNIVSNIHNNKPLGPGFDKREGLFFIANFQHLPNRDSIEWFIDSILPKLGRSDINIDVVGPHMPSRLKDKLMAKGVKVHGFVENVEPFFNSARVFISPLRYGAGVKGKIGQAI